MSGRRGWVLSGLANRPGRRLRSGNQEAQQLLEHRDQYRGCHHDGHQPTGLNRDLLAYFPDLLVNLADLLVKLRPHAADLFLEVRPYRADLLLQTQKTGVHLTAQLIARLYHPACEALLYHRDQRSRSTSDSLPASPSRSRSSRGTEITAIGSYITPPLCQRQRLDMAAGKWFDWWGGLTSGYRSIVDTAPFLALSMLPTRLPFGALLAWSVAVQFGLERPVAGA